MWRLRTIANSYINSLDYNFGFLFGASSAPKIQNRLPVLVDRVILGKNSTSKIILRPWMATNKSKEAPKCWHSWKFIISLGD